MEQFFLQKDGNNIEINFMIQENMLLILGRDNFNQEYKLTLSHKELQNDYIFFQKCNSLKEAFDLIIISFNDNKGYIKEIQINSNIIIGIQDSKDEDICFDLKLKIDNDINPLLGQNFINLNNQPMGNFYYPYTNTGTYYMNGMDYMNNMNGIGYMNNMNSMGYMNNMDGIGYMNNINMNNMNNMNINNMNNMNINNMNNMNMNNMNISNMNNMNMNNMNINNMNNINMYDMNNINMNNMNMNNMNNINMNNMNYMNMNNTNYSQNNILINDNNSMIKVSIMKPQNNSDEEIKDLFGLLKILSMKKLSDIIDKKKLSDNLNNMFNEINKNVPFTGEKNVQLIIENKAYNILIYSQYLINKIIHINEIKDLINKELDPKIIQEFINYWNSLYKYEKYNKFFELNFIKNLRACKFDYSLISMNILENDNSEYEQKCGNCPNMKKLVVFLSSDIGPVSLINNDDLKYSQKTCYGRGFYSTDNIDYLPSFIDNQNNDFIYGKIIPAKSYFSFIAAEIFYDESKVIKTDIEMDISNKNLNIQNYNNQKVEPNGLHYIQIRNNKLSKINKNNKFLAKELVISEKYQIFPFYTLTLKRNDYFVLWRDPNFEDESQYKDFLEDIKLLCFEKANINFYYESSTEEALKFLVRRKYDKPIIITSVGKDLSGKRFAEIVRKILGFDIIILFFSNNKNHLNWIKNFPNCLYTNNADVYKDYITKYNEKDLKKLRGKVEKEYKIRLKPFTFDFILYPNYKNEGDFSQLDFNSYYLRHVNIKNGNKYLCMTEDGNVIISEVSCLWDITIYGNEITLISNKYYLDYSEENDNVRGFKYMVRWNFEIEGDYYYFININKKNNKILSIENNEVKVNKNKVGDTEKFELIDILEEE